METSPTLEWRPSLEQIIEDKFGKETLEEAASLSKSISREMKIRIAEVGYAEGTSRQPKKEVREYLNMWREFVNSLFDRTSSVNLRSPEIVKIAIEGATAILSAEPTREGREAASKMVEALTRRYGKF